MGKFWLGFLVGVIAGVILTIVAVFAIVSRVEPSLSPEVQVPGQVRIGEEFELRVVSQNPHETEVQLHSIDIDEAFLAAFDIMSIDPLPTDSMSLFFVDQYSYFFERLDSRSRLSTAAHSRRPIQHESHNEDRAGARRPGAAVLPIAPLCAE